MKLESIFLQRPKVSFLTRRVKADFLLRQSSPAGSRRTSKHQLLVIQEGGGSGGAWQHQPCSLEDLLTLRKQDIEHSVCNFFFFSIFKILNEWNSIHLHYIWSGRRNLRGEYLKTSSHKTKSICMDRYQKRWTDSLTEPAKQTAAVSGSGLTWNGGLYLVTSTVNWSEMAAPLSCRVTRQK